MTKKLLTTVAVVTLAGASLFGATSAFAQSSQEEGPTALVQKIATKFGLNQSEVQAVFDEHHKEMHTKMQGKFEERLNQLVADGKLTEEQKQKILDKFSELREQKDANREEFKNMTPEERKAAFEKKHEELKAWAEANGIDLQVLPGAFGHGKGMVIRHFGQ